MESNGINITLQSNAVDMDMEDGDDLVEMGDDIVEVERGTIDTQVTVVSKSKRKRAKKLISPVWTLFEILPEKTADGTKKVKCKAYGEVKNHVTLHRNGNLLRHMKTCVKRDTRDVGQMLLSKEDGGIRDLLSFLREDVTSISRNTAKADMLKMHKREKSRLKHMLKETPGKICLTSDLWTSITTDGYICLTTHFIDANWKLQKRILTFSFMPPPHTGVALSEKVYGLLTEWEIKSKVFSLTLENASTNDTFVDFLKSQLNMRNALVGNEMSDSSFNTCPSQLEWDQIEKLSQFLGVFYDITCVCFGTKYPTANLYFPTVFMARLTLDEHLNGYDVYIRKMARLMLDKFDKYWSTFSLTVALAVILDLRYKLQFVE
ncbi:hypothetical protein REPUB_Repub15cG0077500 [Reevesia pubescens]